MHFIEACRKSNPGQKTIGAFAIGDLYCIEICKPALRGDDITAIACSVYDALSLNNQTNLSLKMDVKVIADDATLIMLEVIISDYFSLRPDGEVFISFPRLDHQALGFQCFCLSPFFRAHTKHKRWTIERQSFVDSFNKLRLFPDTSTARWYVREERRDDFQPSFFEEARYFIAHALGAQDSLIVEDDRLADEIAEAVTEVVNNAIEHTHGQILVVGKSFNDMYYQHRDPVKVISWSIVNLSQETISGILKEAIESGLSDQKKEMVREARSLHAGFFAEKVYDEDGFFLLSSFQKGVTRKDTDNSNTYGTGLTRLLESLTKRVHSSYCYAMSGHSVLHFWDNYLHINEDGTIGFNDENDYFGHPPSNKAVEILPFVFPGSIFSLVFALERNHDGNDKH